MINLATTGLSGRGLLQGVSSHSPPLSGTTLKKIMRNLIKAPFNYDNAK